MRKDEERCLVHNRGMNDTVVGSPGPASKIGRVGIRVFGSAILPIFEAEKKILFPHPALSQSLTKYALSEDEKRVRCQKAQSED